MSWDIFVQDIPVDATTVEDIPADFVPAPVGQRSQIIETIREVVPFADFSDPAWGVIDGEDFSIEVSLGTNETVKDFAFHVHGGDVAAAVVSELLGRLKLRAFDAGSGDIFDHQRAATGLREWRAYLQRVTNR
jgi:hypothetical protein